MPFGNYRFAFDGTYRIPYLILTRIDFQTHPYFSYELVDTTPTREIGIETGMSRNIVTQFTAGLTNRIRLIADTAKGKITNSLALTGRYDTRNEIFDPSQGLSVQAAVEGAGGPLGGNNDLYRLTLDARVYQRLGTVPSRLVRTTGYFVVAARAMAGIVRPYGKSESLGVPYYESFTLGGANTIRGYRDRSIGPDSTGIGQYLYGPTVVNGNLELRTPYILRWVALVGFADAGSVARDLRSPTYEYSAGAGIRVRTPIGPVRFDWGRRLRYPAGAGKQPDRYYLGLLHAF
jgi:outer membrane protein assembly factor BamA